MTPRHQLQLTQANCKTTTLTPLLTSRERNFGKPHNRAPLPFCLSKWGKWKRETVPGEKPVCSRGCWLLLSSCCLPPRAAQHLRGHGCLHGSMFYQAVSSSPSHPPCKHPVGKAAPGPRGQSRCQKGRPSSTRPVLHRENRTYKNGETC